MDVDSAFDPQRWGLSVENTKNLTQRLSGLWLRFRGDFKTITRDSSEYAYRYMYGQIGMEHNRNFANIGCNTGVPGQKMQHFMSNSPWSAQRVIQHVQAEIAATPELRGGVLILDESAKDRKGEKSAGAARQYNGRRGKVDMCQVGTLLAYTNGSFEAICCDDFYGESGEFRAEMKAMEGARIQ